MKTRLSLRTKINENSPYLRVVVSFLREIKIMKKFILGIALFIAGIIGFVGWIIACVLKIQPGSISVVFNSLNGSDMVITGIFVVMALVGLILSIIESKKEL